MKRRGEGREGRQPWRPFSCLLSMGEVTWATPILLPNTGKKNRKNKEGRMMGNREGGLKRRLAKLRKMKKKKMPKRLQNKSPIV